MLTAIKFKKEGHCFLDDCWFEDRLAFSFKFCNDLPSKNIENQVFEHFIKGISLFFTLFQKRNVDCGQDYFLLVVLFIAALD